MTSIYLCIRGTSRKKLYSVLGVESIAPILFICAHFIRLPPNSASVYLMARNALQPLYTSNLLVKVQS